MELSLKEVYSLSEIYEIPLTQISPKRGGGDLLGNSTGSSIEFQDYRSYALGDDLRYLDWKAYARNDHLQIKLYRDEVYPLVEVVLDTSKSMNINPEKAEMAWKMALLLVRISLKNCLVRLILIGQKVSILKNWEEILSHPLSFEGNQNLKSFMENFPFFSHHSIRFMISDFLFPVDFGDFVRQSSHRASKTHLIQILTPEEKNPSLKGLYELVDVESSEKTRILMDLKTIERYKRRLDNLQNALASSAQQNRANFIHFSTNTPLSDVCRDSLLPSKIITL